jgi:hypothetical protein
MDWDFIKWLGKGLLMFLSVIGIFAILFLFGIAFSN